LDKSAPRSDCGNCGATLTGPYCSACGQHAHESARSAGALFHDAWHLATHLDGRLWQTLYILLFKPGKPTVAAPEKSRSTILDIDDCDDIKIPFTWLQNSMRQSCVRNKGDNGVSVEHAFLATIPKMMFLFVPMMALVMLILYWRPRRYYVEHLVFFLHTHAAVFLLLLIQAMLGWIAISAAWSIGEWAAAIIGLYSAWYVYRAMRVYYGQGRLLTFTKLCAVAFTYLIGIALTLAATALLSVLIA
jgi:hypothetical protein